MEADERDAAPAEWRAARWVFALGLCFYLLTASGQPYIGDGDLVYWTAERLIDAGTICLDKGRAANTYRTDDGCRVTDYGLGISLALVPGIALLRLVEACGLESGPAHAMVRHLCAYLGPAAMGALAWMFFFLLACRLGVGKRLERALVLTLLLGTTTTVWFYSRVFFSEMLQTAGLLGAFVALHAERRGQGRWYLPVLGAAALGLAVMGKAANFALVPVFGLYLVWDRWRGSMRALGLFAAALLPFVAYQLAYNAFRFGSMLDFGYHSFRDGELGFSHPLSVAVWAYLFSPSKSFFLFNPLTLAALWGWRRFFRAHGAEARLVLATSAVLVFIFGRWWCWHGDWSWGPRFLVVLVPLACLPAAQLMPAGWPADRWRRWAARSGLAVAVALAFFVQLLGCAVPSWKFLAVAGGATRQSFPTWDQRIGKQVQKPIDPLLQVHYLPHFSPILGHWWLAKHLVLQTEDFDSDHPWKSLGIPAWAPRGVKLDYGLDWWGAVRVGEHWGAVLFRWLASLVLLLLAIESLVLARRACTDPGIRSSPERAR